MTGFPSCIHRDLHLARSSDVTALRLLRVRSTKHADSDTTPFVRASLGCFLLDQLGNDGRESLPL